MQNKMLIDASHPEETRVVVVRGNRIEEFDFESQDKKQLRGNIYLARVTRVEPSLQAAFVEYGGNRHGFLAFSEIHPDYYQIPVADRQALLRQEAEAAEEDEEEDESERRGRRRRRSGKGRGQEAERDRAVARGDGGSPDDSGSSIDDGSSDGQGERAGPDPADASLHAGMTARAAAADTHVVSEALDADGNEAGPHENGDGDDDGNGDENGNGLDDGNGSEGDDEVESVGADDAMEEVPSRRKQLRRQYKIQEVIKRRQILLVQVVKEERGNKGAAITTYLSLAGRYSVLMPNTARGGGISRKITSAQDRKRLKEIVAELDVPQGMGVILRTAGANRTKAEIRRDYEYLMRLWENVRTLTLQSTAPTLVYEEGSLIKRSVRDLYNRDIEAILVAGEEGYREAKDFMRMLMPSHAKVVQPYRDNIPIFARNGIEAQLDRMLQPQVTLKSGGYIIINQTEALVSIDVNSGRSTKEHSIEDTALQTNLEAAEEVARQLRLRDLAGLIVIDFIDMEEKRNNRAVEKRLKDHLKNDRARIQVGRISHFGLLEMSRQRIRAGVLESTMKPCAHCGGTGHVRSDSSVALHVVRGIEEFLLKDARHHITVRTPTVTALYVLNHKRSVLADLENRFGLSITIEADDSVGSQHYAITRGQPVEKPVATPLVEASFQTAEVEPEEEAHPQEASAEGSAGGEDGDGDRSRKKRRRRRRRGGRDREAAANGEATQNTADSEEPDPSDSTAGDEVGGVEAGPSGADETSSEDVSHADSGEGERKKRRRGKRGGRRNRIDEPDGQGDDLADAEQPVDVAADADASNAAPAGEPQTSESRTEEEVQPASAPDLPGEAEPAAVSDPVKPKRAPRRARQPKKPVAADETGGQDAISDLPAMSGSEAVVPVDEPAPSAPAAPQETGAEPQAPARKPRATRRKAAAAGDAGQTSPEPAASSREETKPSAEDSAPEPGSAELVGSEASEPVVVSSGGQGKDQDVQKPRKGGWWQRRSFF